MNKKQSMTSTRFIDVELNLVEIVKKCHRRGDAFCQFHDVTRDVVIFFLGYGYAKHYVVNSTVKGDKWNVTINFPGEEEILDRPPRSPPMKIPEGRRISPNALGEN